MARSHRCPCWSGFRGGAFTARLLVAAGIRRGAFCAEEDAVIVTCNCGSVRSASSTCAPQEASPTAVFVTRSPPEWVRDNIAASAATPRQVAIFGESAGGGIVLHIASSPSARFLYRGAIVQSGATFNTLDEARAALCSTPSSPSSGSTTRSSSWMSRWTRLVRAQSVAQGILSRRSA